MVRLKRDSGWADKARAYKVLLNGETIGTIRDGEEKAFTVDAGQHELAIGIDWCRCPAVSFEVTGETEVVFECGSNLRGLKMFIGFVYAFFLRDQYVWLKRA